MNPTNYMKLNELLLWLSVFFYLMLSWFVSYSYLEILLYWVFSILVLGNARRLFYKPCDGLLFVIRRSLYVIPFVLPLFRQSSFVFFNRPDLNWLIAGLLVGLLGILPRWKNWRIVLSKDFIAFSAFQSSWRRAYIILILCIVPLAEEFFFRFVLIESAPKSMLVLNIFLSAFMFFLSHYGTKWASSSFSTYDFIMQFLFGLLSAVLLIFSHSLIPSILAHFIYNSPHVLQQILHIMHNAQSHVEKKREVMEAK